MNHMQKEKFQLRLESFGFGRMKRKSADAGLREQESRGITVTFLGVRGSVPLGGARREKYGGETACVHVNAGGQDFFLDAGTGITESRSLVDLTSDPVILLSHFHLDHIQGLVLSDLMMTPGLRLRILGPGTEELPEREAPAKGGVTTAPKRPDSRPGPEESISPAGAAGAGSRTEGAVRRMMSPPLWPVGPEHLQADASFSDISVSEGRGSLSFETEGAGEPVKVSVMEGDHPGGVLLFRILWKGKSVVYATDCIFGSVEEPDSAEASGRPEAAMGAAEQTGFGSAAGLPEAADFFPPERIGIQQKYIDFARGCDLLIADGQYSDREWLKKSHFGHSSVTMAAELGRRCGAGQTVIIHHDHGASDQALDAFDRYLRLHYAGCRMGRRGDIITL